MSTCAPSGSGPSPVRESCTVGDMTYLAIKLSDAGVGDYWDDADRFVRNCLAEHQITDPAKLKKASETEPFHRADQSPKKSQRRDVGAPRIKSIERGKA